jgi:fructose-1,6-bisphosphatase I
MPPPITLDRFILEEQRSAPGATGELSLLLMRFGVAGKRIAHALSRSNLSGTVGSAGTENVQGEAQKKLDVIANEILVETFDYGGLVTLAASEEMAEPYPYGGGESAKYSVLFDPLDGSSNIDCNGTLGTIFSVRPRRGGGVADLLRSGREQVAAGYLLFGPSVLLVYTTGNGVHLFALDHAIGEFVLSRWSVRMPDRGKGYAVNEGRAHAWAPGVRRFVEHLKEPDKTTGRPYSTRYSAALVGDVHRFLLEGGIYMYPADAVSPEATASGKRPRGKLRVLYECHPLAFVVEQAGGRASTGSEDVLDVVPQALHDRIPLAIGSRFEVDLYDEFARS